MAVYVCMQIALADIKPPKTLLRLVDKMRVEYHELVNSIREHGLLKPILVRPVEGGYEIVDGMNRFSACRDLGHDLIEVLVREVSDEDVALLQIQANAVQVETNPIEYAAALRKILRQNPEWTLKDLSAYVKKGVPWVSKILNLTYLHEDYHPAVVSGELSIVNATELARLPQAVQIDQFHNACTMPHREFRALVAGTVKRLREARRQEDLEVFLTVEFQPRPFLRTLNQLVTEHKHQKNGAYAVAKDGCRNAVEGFYAGLRWAMHLDPLSIEVQKRSALSRQEQLHEESLKRKKRNEQLDDL